MLAMPLVYEQRVWGVLYAHTFRQREFSDHEVNLWSALAAQAAGAVRNLWLSQQSQTWQEMTRDADACTDLRSLYRLFAERAMEAFHADFAVFYPYDPTTRPERLIQDDVTVVGTLKKTWQPPTGGLGGCVYRSVDEPPSGLLIVNDLAAEQGRYGSHLAQREGVKAFVAVRVDVIPEGESERRRAGMLFLNYRHRTAFAPSDFGSLQAAANHVAATVLRLQALALAQRRSEALRSQMEAVMEILKAFRAKSVRESVLNAIAKQVRKMFGGDIYGVLEYDREKGLFVLRGVSGTKDARFTLEDAGKFKPFLEHTAPIRISDATQHDVMKESGFVRRNGIQSLVIYPLRCSGEPVGLLFENYKEMREVDDGHVNAVLPFADLAAVVISEARLRDSLEATRKRLERRMFLTWVSMIEASWRHGVVTKASAVRNHVALVQRRLQECSASVSVHDEIKTAVDAIDTLANAIASAPPRVPQSWEMEPEVFPLGPLLVEMAQRESGPPAGDVRVQIVADVQDLGDVQISGYRRWIIYALELLLENARNAMPEGGTIRLVARRVGDWAEVRIRDAGKGIPESIQQKVFREPVRSGRDPRRMGMGCVLAATVVEEHGGTIEVERTGPEGTTVLFRLPLAGGIG